MLTGIEKKKMFGITKFMKERMMKKVGMKMSILELKQTVEVLQIYIINYYRLDS